MCNAALVGRSRFVELGDSALVNLGCGCIPKVEHNCATDGESVVCHRILVLLQGFF